MVEDQCRISRPFRDVVKKTLDGPHASDRFSSRSSVLNGLLYFDAQLFLTISSPGLAYFCFERARSDW